VVSRAVVGHTWALAPTPVEAGRIRQFARSIGETDPVHFDAGAARQAGYRDVVAPPTFALVVEVECLDPARMLGDLGIDIARILHADQDFSYHHPICAGDVLHGQVQVTNVFDKKGGALTFIDIRSELRGADGEAVVGMRRHIVVRNHPPS